jgi:hypothetical protein
MNVFDAAPAITDRLVRCPSCKGFMQFVGIMPCGENLPDMPTFECKRCAVEVAVEQALEVLEQTTF